MRFQCQNPECSNPNTQKLFHYTAKDIVCVDDSTLSFRETMICPYCQSKDFIEYTEPAPVQEEIQNVYVHDLTTGAQTKLDELLAQGYKIQARYAKQYFLEKPKES